MASAARLSTSRRSAISRCVAEAVRLRVQSIDVRFAASDLQLPSSGGDQKPVHIPRGRILAICPFELHHDPALYGDDAWEFRPDRPELKLGDGATVVASVSGRAMGRGLQQHAFVVGCASSRAVLHDTTSLC